MATDILHVVIDERKRQFESVDELPFISRGQAHNASRNVIKHYILSSEVFMVESSLN